jgi:hypothetical protein
MTPVGGAINNIDVPRTRIARKGSCIVSEIGKIRGRSMRIREALLFRRLRENSNNIVTMERWRSYSSHRRSFASRFAELSGMRAASPEEREARDIRRAPRQPKPEGFLGGAAAWLTRVLGIIFREKVKKMLTRFGHNR